MKTTATLTVINLLYFFIYLALLKQKHNVEETEIRDNVNLIKLSNRPTQLMREFLSVGPMHTSGYRAKSDYKREKRARFDNSTSSRLVRVF